MYEVNRAADFRLPARWPHRTEQLAASGVMANARALSGTLSPTRLGTPSILDQGDVGSCGGQAIVQNIHVCRQDKGQASEILSPAFPYWCARREAVATDFDVEDTGIDPFDMVTAIADFGACPWRNMPYDESQPNRKPGALAFQTAQKIKARMEPTFASGDELRDFIQYTMTVERKAPFLGIEVVPSFDNVGFDGIVDDVGGDVRGLHAVAGYEWVDEGTWIANSWSIGFGKAGCALLTWRWLAEHCVFAASVEVVQ